MRQRALADIAFQQERLVRIELMECGDDLVQLGLHVASRKSAVIACDKREASVQGSEAAKQSTSPYNGWWIVSLSLSSGGASRRPVGSQ
jgi:hypothetical protein